VLIRAFTEEFGPHEPVRLRLNHSYQRLEVDVPDDPRIVLTNQFLDNAGVLAFYGELDAYVLPTRGEGFGLTGLEALSTGLPLIATNWSGPAEYLDPADTYPLRYELVDAAGFHFMFRRHFGRWAEPDVMHLRELLRHVYEHRDEAAERGRRAAERVHREWTWARVARQLVADFDLLAQGVTPS
jgi:glycosyltransferase involved in cell wall biosynthesis